MRFAEAIAVMLINVVINLQFSLLDPILPLEVKRRDISQDFTGLIMGCMSAGYFVCPYYVTEAFIPRLGRRGSVFLGFMVMSASLLLYGLGYFVPDAHQLLFVGICMLARLLEGAGMAIATTAIVSLIAKLFPHEMGRAQQIRFLGAFSGPAVGVVLGSFLFKIVGYFWVFISFSLLVFLSSFLVFVFEEDSSRSHRPFSASLTFCSLLRVRRVALVVVCGLITYLLHYSLESSLALRLREGFGFSPSTTGLFFAVFLAGTITLGVVGMLFPESWDKRTIFMVLFWVNVVSALLIGPSKALHFPDEPALIGVGLFLGGSLRSFVGAYIIVEGVSAGAAKFPESGGRVGDLMASIYQTGEGVAMLVSPVYGSSVSGAVGFRSAMDIEAGVFSVSSLVFTLFVVSDLRRKKKQRLSRRENSSEDEREDRNPLLLES